MTHTPDPHLFERPINILDVAVAETAAPTPVNPFEASSLASRSVVPKPMQMFIAVEVLVPINRWVQCYNLP